MGIIGKQNQCCQTGRTDSVTFRHSFRRIADSIQRIGNGTDGIRHTGHFSDTTGIIGNRTVCIECNDDTGHG